MVQVLTSFLISSLRPRIASSFSSVEEMTEAQFAYLPKQRLIFIHKHTPVCT